jgi:hypothetical protein
MISNPSLNTDFLVEVAKGNVPGHSFIRKFGSIDSITNAVIGSDVWEFGAVDTDARIYTFSDTADIDTMSSSDADDTAIMTIEGLNGALEPIVQSKALDGTAKVTLDTPLKRLNRAYNSNGIVLEGNVYIYVDGDTTTPGIPDEPLDVRGYVSAGSAQTLQCVYTVPAGFTGNVMGYEASMTKSVGATSVNAIMSGHTREDGKVFRVQDEFSLISSGTSDRIVSFPIMLPFPEKTDFVCHAVTSATFGVSWSLTILLVDNNFING